MAANWKEDLHITHRSFRIVDIVAPVPPILEGRLFEDCTIYGPAVLLPLSETRFEQCTFDAAPEAIFWELLPTRDLVVGGIGVAKCAFTRCHFFGIGIAGRREVFQLFTGAAPKQVAETDHA